jgi:choline kinase
MLNRHRLKSKKKSKTEAVQSLTARRLENENIHIGPSDYVPWQKDSKVCFIRMEGKLFGDVSMDLELRLFVEDLPNSAGVAIDLICCPKLALDRGIGGVIEAPSAYFCKHPPRRFTDDRAYRMMEDFIKVVWSKCMKCLIIAAGKGSRLQSRGDIKPLVPILGKPIIERVIRNALGAGLREIYVVTGYKGPEVRAFLYTIAGQNNIPIKHVINHEWEKGNGLSVLKAKAHLKEKFILMMGDHLVDPALLKNLIMQKISDGGVMLGVDRRTENPLVNMTDVTKAVINNGSISNIGKALKSYNAFDTGTFLCSPAIFQDIEKSISEHGDTSLSGGVRCLAKQGKLKAFDIGGTFWIDVDDPESLCRVYGDHRLLFGELYRG